MQLGKNNKGRIIIYIMGKLYIHYGAKELLPIQPISNCDYFTKPNGGLWASPVDAKFGWNDWCKQEHFRTYEEDNYFKFVVKNDSKIIHIFSVKDLEELPQQKDKYGIHSSTSMCYLDFEKLQKDYDGIELHLSDEKFGIDQDFCSGLYFRLYGWDCDSILIFNEDSIEVVS